MDLRQMRYFLAVAQEGNFGRAAERLHITQPPLTRQMHALEKDIGTALFLRTAKGVELTEAGATLLEEVPGILASIEGAHRRSRRAAEGRLGRIEVCVFTASVLGIIPRILARFHAERPDVEIGIWAMNKPVQIDALLNRRITIGFARFVPPTPGLTVEVVLRESLVVALHSSSPLCAMTEIPLAALEDQPMILYPNVAMPGLAQEILHAFGREKLRLNIVQRVDDVLTCAALVSAGFGFSITPDPVLNLRLPNVVYRPLKCASLPYVELNCVYRSNDDAPVLREFLKVTRAISGSSDAA